MKRNTLLCSLVTALLLTASSLSATKIEIPEVTADGLHHVKDSKLALVYAQPGVDFSQYQRVYLADTYVAFKKNWQRNQNRSGSSAYPAA